MWTRLRDDVCITVVIQRISFPARAAVHLDRRVNTRVKPHLSRRFRARCFSFFCINSVQQFIKQFSLHSPEDPRASRSNGRPESRINSNP